EVRGDDGGADVASEAGPSAPGAPLEPEAALEERDPTLDAGAEVPEAAVDPVAPRHVAHLEGSLLGEGEILHAERLALLQIGSRSVAAVEGGLPRHPAVDLLL